jgi:hypothetical protein
VSFTAPNHARVLSWSLSSTWLYIASVIWVCVLTRHPVDPVSLAAGGVSIGLLVYDATIVHRALLANILPLGFSFYSGVWGMSGDLATVLRIAGLSVLAVSCLVILWTVYHTHRDKLTLERGLPIAFLLALPLVVHQLAGYLLGIDIYDAVFSELLGLP